MEGYSLEPTAEYTQRIPALGEGVWFKLTSDIDLASETNWTPIGNTGSSCFLGRFDGGHHTVSNLKINNAIGQYNALFARIGQGGGLRCLNLENATITTTSSKKHTAGLVAYIGGYDVQNLDSCNVSKVTVSANAGMVGALVGEAQNIMVRYCNADSCSVTQTYNTPDGNYCYVGALAGFANNVSYCKATHSTVKNTSYYTGGVVGRANAVSYSDAVNCTVTTTGYGYYTGGVTGYCDNVSHCRNINTTVDAVYYTGGVAGYGTCSYCSNNGNVSGTQLTGGIVGHSNKAAWNSYCYNTGLVSAKHTNDNSNRVGGIAGYGSCQFCFNTGKIIGSRNVADGCGGITGGNYNNNDGTSTSYITQYCYNAGEVVGNSVKRAGGVSGYTKAVYSYNVGRVSGGTESSAGVGHWISTTAGSRYYDKQMCPNTTYDTAYGKLTTQMIGDELKGGKLAANVQCDSNWVFLPGMYPQLKYFYNSPDSVVREASRVSATPVFLYVNGDTVETVNNVMHPVTFGAGATDTVKWNLAAGSGLTVLNNIGTPQDSMGVAVVHASIRDTVYREVRFLTNINADNPLIIKDLANLRIFRNGINSGKVFYYQLSTKDFTTDPHPGENDFMEIPVGGEDIFFKLAENTFDLSEERSWTPIGLSTSPFKGSFDGNHQVIENMSIEATSNYAGFFGYAIANDIRNLKFSEANISGSTYSYIGTLGGYIFAKMDSCVVENSAVNSTTGSYVGGMLGFGQNSASHFVATDVTVTKTGAGNYVGGILGDAQLHLDSCVLHNSTITATSTGSVGGIVGRLVGGNINRCVNEGSTVTGQNYTGGIAGQYALYTYNYYSGEGYRSWTGDMTYCHNTSTVTGSSYVGGLTGGGYSRVKFSYNTGSVTGAGYVGGAAGYLAGVANSFNTGTVTCSNGYVGGILGYQGWNITFTQNFNTGKVIYTGNNAGHYAGGIAGGYDVTISHCFNAGEVDGRNAGYAAGIGANTYNSTNPTYSVNVGRVHGNNEYYPVSYYKNATNCFNDRQMCPFIGTARGEQEKLTSEMLGSNLQTTLGANWIYEPGMYPRLRWTDTCEWAREVAIVASTPILLGSNDEVNNISQDFSLAGKDSVVWKIVKGSGITVNPDYTCTQEGIGIAYLGAAWTDHPDSIFKEVRIINISENNPVIIKNKEQFCLFRDLINSGKEFYFDAANREFHATMDNEDWIPLPMNGEAIHFRLDADVDLSGANWIPIGSNSSATARFRGYFNGNNKEISGMSCNGNTYQGLFGYTSGGFLKNVNITNASVVQKGNYGAVLCAYNNGTAVTNCSVTSSTLTSSGGYYLGLVCGYAEQNTFTNSRTSACSLKSDSSQYVGGICGYAKNSGIGKCYNESNIQGANVGGICGVMEGDSSIRYCYNLGDIKDNGFRTKTNDDVFYIGGITSAGDVSLSYNAGRVFADNATRVAGITAVGKVDSSYNIGYVAAASSATTIFPLSGEGTIKSSVNDAQMAPYGVSSSEQHKRTLQMTGTSLQGTLGTTNWDYNEDRYPMLKDLNASDTAVAHSIAIYLAGTNNVSTVRKHFVVTHPTTASCSWSRKGTGNSLDMSTINIDDSVKVKHCGFDTLKVTYGNGYKNIALLVDQLEVTVLKVHTCGDPFYWEATKKTYTRTGVYTEAFALEDGCDSIITLDLVIPKVLNISTSFSNITCNGNNNGWVDVTATGGNSGKYNVVWLNESSDTIGKTARVENLGPGSYTVIVADSAYLDCFQTETVEINEPTLLEAGILDYDPQCYGIDDGYIEMYVKGGVKPYTITYTKEGGAPQSKLQPDADTIRLENLPDGNYTVSVKDRNECEVTGLSCSFAQNSHHYIVRASGESKLYDAVAVVADTFTIQIDEGEPFRPELNDKDEYEMADFDGYSDYLKLDFAKVTRTDVGTEDNTITSCKVWRRYDDQPDDSLDVTCSYNLEYYDGVVNITKRYVTLTSATAAQIGNVPSPLTAETVEETGDGWAPSHSINYTDFASISDIGIVSNTFTPHFSDSSALSNYDIQIHYGTLAMLEDTTHRLLLSGSSQKLYDGTPLTNGEYSIAPELPAGYTLTDVVLSGNITKAGTDTNKIVSFTILNGSGVDVTAFFRNIHRIPGVLTVRKREVSLKSNSATKEYDGTPLTRPLLTQTGDGFLPADIDGSITVTGTITMPGTQTNTISYTTTSSYNPINYNLIVDEGTLTVTPRALSITGESVTMVYDGEEHELTNYSTSGLVSGQHIEGLTYSTGSHHNVGNYTGAFDGASTFSILDAVGNNVKNGYEITGPTPGTLKINPSEAFLVLKSGSASKTYDGMPLTSDRFTVSCNGVNLPRILDGKYVIPSSLDTITITSTFDGITNADTVANTFNFTITNQENYSTDSISKQEGIIAIAKRPISFTSGDATQVYSGAPVANNQVEIGGWGFVDDDENNIHEGADFSNFAQRIEVGVEDNTFSYEFKSGTLADNYDVDVFYGELEVTKKMLTLTANNKSRQFGLENPEFDYTVQGLVAGEESTVITAQPTLTTTAGIESPTGTYTINIDVSTAEADNYSFTGVNGTLTIGKRDITIHTSTDTVVYDALEHSITTFDPFTLTINGHDYVANYDDVSTTTGTHSEIGTYDNVLQGNLDNLHINYNGMDYRAQFEPTVVTGHLTILRDTLIVTVDDVSSTYGEELSYTYTMTGFAGSETEETLRAAGKLNGTVTYSTSATSTSPVGDYTVTPVISALSADNYAFKAVNGKLTINQRPITVTGRDSTFYFDGNPHSIADMHAPYYTIDSTQLVSGHNLTAVVTSATISELDATTPTEVGEVTITDADGNDVMGNYAVTKVNGTLKIEGFPGAIVITSASAELECTGLPQKKDEYTVTYAGTPLTAVTGSNGLKFAMPTATHDTLTITPTFAGITTPSENADSNNVYTCALQNDTKYVGTRTLVKGTVRMYDSLKVVVTPTPVTCNGLNDGKADVTITGGKKNAGNYSYKLDGGTATSTAGTVNLTSLTNGSHTFYVSDSLNYNKTVNFTITQPDTLTLTLTSDNPVCEDGSVMSFTTGGNGGNKFKLNEAAEDDLGIYNHLSADSYTVTVTDSKGCSATQSVTLTGRNVEVKRGLTRTGQLAIYSADTLMVDRKGGRYLFPALGRTGETIPQPKMEAFGATGSTSSITVSVKVAAVGAAPMLELEVATDANFDATTVMYTYKPASVSDGTTYSHTFTKLPAGMYYCRAKLYNCSGAVTTEVVTVTVPIP